MGSESKYYKEIVYKLERLIKKEYTLAASIGIQKSFSLAILIFTLFVLAEMFAHFSSAIRTTLFLIFLFISAASLILLFIIPLLKYFKILRKTNYLETARRVGDKFPLIKDDLVNSMQLVLSEKAEAQYSKGLVEAAFYNIYNKIKNVEFTTIVSLKKAKEPLLYFAGALILCGILILFVPGLKAASFRLINYRREFIPPPKFIFNVEPGNSKVTKGDSIKITIGIAGQAPKEVNLNVKNADQTSFEPLQLYPDTLGKYYYVIPAVRSSFKYYAASGNIKSDIYEIEVIDRPIIKTMDLTITSPSYTKIPQVQQKDNGNVTALLGSVVDIRITSTKNLKGARIEFDDTTKKNLEIIGNEAQGKFIVKNDVNYHIALKDTDNNNNLEPIEYSIKALYDAFPTIQIIAPNHDVNLPNDNRVGLAAKIADDFGFTKLLLHYRLSSSKYEKAQNNYTSLEIPINKNQTEEEADYIWNLSDLNLSSEDVVTYYLEVFDNDFISGPKSAKSSIFNIRVPSLNDILNQASDIQNQSQNDLKDTFKAADDLKQKLDNIKNELRQDKKDITWQEKQKIEQAAEQFKKLQDKINDVGKNIEKMQQNLQENNLLSKETLQKYMELQKLFSEISTDEMKKAMEQLQNALQNLNRQMTQEAIEKMSFNEEQFKQTIERTLNLLKRIQVEQKVDEMLKRTDQLTKQQEDIQNKTEKLNSQNSDDKNQLSEKQNDISKELNDYKKQLDELSRKVSELKDLPKDQLDQIRKEFQQQENENMSEQASDEIQKNQNQLAQQNQSKISKNMGSMKQQLQKFKQSMNQQGQMQAFKDMMKITDNLITLSKQQESLKNQTQQMDPGSSQFDKDAQQQNEISSNLNKIMQQMSQLSQKTFAITPEMGKALGDAQRQMNASMQGLQNRNGNMASSNQGQAMESLNEAADMMKNSMQQMMQNGGQGGGMMSFMQQLNKMSGMQMNLNNLTQMLQQAMNGSLTMQQQAELQRLAQQQDVIRKSMQELNKEAMRSGESKKIPADLNEIANQMEEVVKNMTSDNLNEKTVQEQEHILSRLLDAQKSINQRDYENKRESQSGKDITSNSPAELNLSSQQQKNKIKDELDKAVQEGYTKDFENLIRKYYEALEKENIQQGSNKK